MVLQRLGIVPLGNGPNVEPRALVANYETDFLERYIDVEFNVPFVIGRLSSTLFRFSRQDALPQFGPMLSPMLVRQLQIAGLSG